MNKHERRACASFIREHVHNIVTLRRSDTEEPICTIMLRPHKKPSTWLNKDKYGNPTYGRLAERERGTTNLILPMCIADETKCSIVPTDNGWVIPDRVVDFLHSYYGMSVTQRFCVKTDETMFPIADDLTTVYEFARMFRKFVGKYTVLVSRGPVLYASLRNKITFARQSGNQLIIDSRNLYSGQSLADLFDELRKLHE